MSNLKPIIYIRVDGNETIATGHVMRCLSIAVQLKKMGCAVIFLTADDKPKELIQSRGFTTKVLHTRWDQMDDETEILCRYLNDHDASILMIDSYQVTYDYLDALSQSTKVVYIDDLYHFPYPVHTVINYSVWAKEEDYVKIYQNPLPQFLIGGSYIPLREEFTHIKRTINPNVQNILITMGGTDSYNVIGKLLHRITLPSMEYHVIVGIFNQNKEELYALAKQFPNIHLHENVSNISDYMRQCDIAISAGGSTLYELCACGTPTICLEIADNQNGAYVWEEHDYMLYAGNIAKDEETCLAACLSHLNAYINNYQLRRSFSERMQSLVDGKGARRIAEYLLSI